MLPLRPIAYSSASPLTRLPLSRCAMTLPSAVFSTFFTWGYKIERERYKTNEKYRRTDKRDGEGRKEVTTPGQGAEKRVPLFYVIDHLMRMATPRCFVAMGWVMFPNVV